MGYYWQKPGEKWIFHFRMGWIYLNVEDDESVWLWISKFNDWFWTQNEVYPYLYANSLLNSGWFLIDEERTSPNQFIYYLFDETTSIFGQGGQWLSK